MDWVYIGFLFGSFVVSGYPTEEDCVKQKVLLEKHQIDGECVKAPLPAYYGDLQLSHKLTFLPSVGVDPYKMVAPSTSPAPFPAPDTDIH